MRRVSRGWPSRLLATVMTVALTLAYWHAAGHPLPQGTHAAGVAWATHHAGGHAPHSGPAFKATAAKPAHTGGTDNDGDGTGHSAPDCCCDTICHGGQAILAPDALLLPPPHSVPAMQPAAAFAGAEAGGLDRPPKAFLPA